MTLAELDLPGGPFTLRNAEASDVGPIVGLMAADSLRSSVDPAAIEDRDPYTRAFQAMEADPAQLLVAVVTAADEVVATMQLTFIPGLARGGATRLQIEAVRVRSDLRSNGLGGAMITWAINEGRRRGAQLVQLTSDGSRVAAHRFYQRLGFEASHVGSERPPSKHLAEETHHGLCERVRTLLRNVVSNTRWDALAAGDSAD
ncbi:GNAT family N-acetyltransferase [Arthrobacter sp. SO3]|uniref:GNAT family N-acetyltransferase n=1 Tax=Arthrobacter sp. SO3 TaxID=1897057 RepID=UPI00299D4894|nr:GNAT family N-acetyltransferase [Arthrobacter sp. SO3]MCB5291162.1 Mycothiol acetyltransferase [Arthrobacter sp. SO3]